MSETTMLKNRSGESGSARVTGAVLVAATVLEVLVMAHHPSVRAPDLATAVEQLGKIAGLSAVVHGTLIVLLLVGFYCLTEFSRLLGLHRPAVRAGLVAYAVGVIAMVGAATVDGLVTGQVAAHVLHDGAENLQITRQILVLCEVLNQALARMGTVATAIGIAAWSAALWRIGGLARAIGVFGILLGVLSAAALLSGALQLDVHRMLLVVTLEGVWTVGAGVLLLRRSV